MIDNVAAALRKIDDASIEIQKRLWQLRYTYGEEQRAVKQLEYMCFRPRLTGDQADDKHAFKYYTPEAKLHVLKTAVDRLDELRAELRFMESQNEQGQLRNRLREEFGIALAQ